VANRNNTLSRPNLLNTLKHIIVKASDQTFPFPFIFLCCDVEGGIALSNDIGFGNCSTTPLLELVRVKETELYFLVQYFDVGSR